MVCKIVCMYVCLLPRFLPPRVTRQSKGLLTVLVLHSLDFKFGEFLENAAIKSSGIETN